MQVIIKLWNAYVGYTYDCQSYFWISEFIQAGGIFIDKRMKANVWREIFKNDKVNTHTNKQRWKADHQEINLKPPLPGYISTTSPLTATTTTLLPTLVYKLQGLSVELRPHLKIINTMNENIMQTWYSPITPVYNLFRVGNGVN